MYNYVKQYKKEILNIGTSLCGSMLIINSLDLSFRKVKINKRDKCICDDKNN